MTRAAAGVSLLLGLLALASGAYLALTADMPHAAFLRGGGLLVLAALPWASYRAFAGARAPRLALGLLWLAVGLLLAYGAVADATAGAWPPGTVALGASAAVALGLSAVFLLGRGR